MKRLFKTVLFYYELKYHTNKPKGFLLKQQTGKKIFQAADINNQF